jgi:hypothetical protein
LSATYFAVVSGIAASRNSLTIGTTYAARVISAM